jgi:hypothetical protein
MRARSARRRPRASRAPASRPMKAAAYANATPCPDELCAARHHHNTTAHSLSGGSALRASTSASASSARGQSCSPPSGPAAHSMAASTDPPCAPHTSAWSHRGCTRAAQAHSRATTWYLGGRAVRPCQPSNGCAGCLPLTGRWRSAVRGARVTHGDHDALEDARRRPGQLHGLVVVLLRADRISRISRRRSRLQSTSSARRARPRAHIGRVTCASAAPAVCVAIQA